MEWICHITLSEQQKNGGKRNEQTNNDIHGAVGGPEL